MTNDSMHDILGPGGVISKRLPGYEARPPQIAMAETVAAAIEARQHAVVEGGTGVGKALDVDTPIATPTGWTRMGDLRAGDTVFDETGTPTRVVEAFDVMHDRPCYEIEFSDGSTLVADEEHEWTTWDLNVRKAYDYYRQGQGPWFPCDWATWSSSSMSKVKYSGGERDEIRRLRADGYTCAQIGAIMGRSANAIEQQQHRPDHGGPCEVRVHPRTTLAIAATLRYRHIYNHTIPLSGALQYTAMAHPLPLDPYVFGYLLGDGNTSGSGRVACDPQDRKWLMDEFGSRGYHVTEHADMGHFGVKGIHASWLKLGLSDGKYIPDIYLRAAIYDRIALAQGLIDSDGCVDNHGAYRFTNNNRRLLSGFIALMRGLGHIVRVSPRIGRQRRGITCRDSWEVIVPSTMALSRLPRKEKRVRHGWKREQACRYITAVRPVPSRPVRCIGVTAPSHLYLAGESLIPTHNSLAYLIPAIYSGKKVIVSTANKALQDQLVAKDIPFLQHALPRDVTAALVKGRANYLCLDHFEHEDAFQTMSGRNRDYQALKQWATRTRTGDFEELETLPSRDLLARVSSTARSCTGNACPSFGYCYVERMRDRAERVGIVVCNHALLLADLVLRDLGAHLLPDRDLIIVDEAHRLEDAALNALTVSLARRDVAELVESTLLQRHAGSRTASELLTLADDLFRPFETAPARNRAIVVEELGAALRLSEALDAIHEQLVRHNPYKDLAQPTPESRHYERLLEWTDRLTLDSRVIGRIHDEDCVRYVEYGLGVRSREATLKWTPVDVAEPLERLLFKQTPVICTSATLAVGDFAYFRRSVGIDEAVEFVAPSPFDYAAQCLLYVPAHLPEFRTAATPAYTEALCGELERLVRASGGRAFLLFTSYRGLEEAYTRLCERLPYPLLKQGELSRAELLRRFRAEGDAVLFATKSFWEGVDVVGEALSLVVIDRVPFGVPDDPIVATRVARLKREEGDWFNDLMLPTAILQLKQGFGRLIRSGRDRGVVALLDSRIAHKGYGRRIVEALPPARLVHHIEQVEEFFVAEGHEPL